MAEGGINAALDTSGQGDSMEEHFRDTMEAGVAFADPNAVRALTEAEAVQPFGWAWRSTARKQARWICGISAGRKRSMAFAQSSTGRQVMAALIQEARRRE